VHSEARARVDFARNRLAPAARERTLRWYQSHALRSERKEDGSIVTPVDRETEDLLRQLIAQEFPRDGVLGEERGETPTTPGDASVDRWRWVLDPIDGTGSFVRGLPHWVLLIGIERNHEPLAGLIDAPAVAEMFWASRGGGAFWTLRNGETRPARVSGVGALDQALIEIAPVQWFNQHGLSGVHARVCAASRRNRGWSDGYAFALLATGRVDAAVNFGFHRWDLSACAAIIEEAGGRISDWTGARDLDAQRIVACNPLLHAALIETIGRVDVA
jgi:histidinol-phosphatase